jgi:hypothetical protein
MKKIASTIATVAITFVITLALNLIIELLTQDKGAVMIGPVVTIQGQPYMPIDISNHAQEPLDNVVLSIPESTDSHSIISSSPIEVEEIPDVVGTGIRKRIQISGLEPSRVTQLLVPMTDQDASELVRLVNAKQIGLAIERVEDIERPISLAMKDAVVTASIYAVIVAIGTLWFYAQLSDRREETEAVRKKLDEAMAQARELELRSEEQASELAGKLRRIQILLLARLSDYSKELTFWRDTIRKILYQTTGDSKVSEKVIDQITETLKTYGTRSGAADDFETIEVLAGILSNSRDSKGETKQ